MERNRIWAANEVLHRLEVIMQNDRVASLAEIDKKFNEGKLGIVGRDEEQQIVEAEYKEAITIMRENFAKTNPELKERVR
jgi:hypothetical protein